VLLGILTVLGWHCCCCCVAAVPKHQQLRMPTEQ